eukprot:scaffold81689_cov34-Tisochrysis_lutea.AAC.2
MLHYPGDLVSTAKLSSLTPPFLPPSTHPGQTPTHPGQTEKSSSPPLHPLNFVFESLSVLSTQVYPPWFTIELPGSRR